MDRATVWDFGDLVIEPAAWEVRLAGRPVELTKTEYRILITLAQRARRVVTNDELTALVWGDGWFGDDGNIAVHVSKLRRKLGESASQPRYIRTIRGVGYRFEGGAADRLEPDDVYDVLRADADSVEICTDAELRVVTVRPVDARPLGWDPGDLLGRYFPVADYDAWQSHDSALHAMEVLVASGVRQWSARHAVRRADGSTVLADLATRIETEPDGRLRGLCFVLSEIRGGIGAAGSRSADG